MSAAKSVPACARCGHTGDLFLSPLRGAHVCKSDQGCAKRLEALSKAAGKVKPLGGAAKVRQKRAQGGLS